MKRWLYLAFLVFLLCIQSASSRRSNSPRGGASRWSPNPVRGVRSPGASQRQQYPTVQDLDDDAEDSKQVTKDMIDAFLTRDSRNTFIGQLLFTAGVITFFGLNPDFGSWMRHSGSLVPLLSLGLSTFAWFLICGSVRARRESPIKWQLLGLFTFGESIAVGFITSFYKFSAVVSAMGATAVAASTVSAYAILNKNPKYDLSQWGAGLSSAAVILVTYAVIHLLELYGVLPAGFLPYREAWFSAVGAVLFSLFLAYHTKLIVGGKHAKYQMNEKDYVYGAMSLYTDILNMFIYILRVLGEDDRK